MKITKKLRDVTPEELKEWYRINCDNHCDGCIFDNVYCCIIEGNHQWLNHKDLYSDKFLDQTIEVEVPDILTKEEKDNPYCIPLNEVENNFSKKIDTLILVDKIKIINTKNGERMAFLTGSDETTTMEYTLFPKVFNAYPTIKKGDLLKVRRTVEKRLNQFQIIVEKIRNLQGEENEK